MFLRLPIAVLLLLVLAYGGFKAWPLISGPRLHLAPFVVEASDGFMTISGQAKHTETLTLNGGTLLIDETGHFSKVVTLPRGGVILSFAASDRFGRTHATQKEVIIP